MALIQRRPDFDFFFFLFASFTLVILCVCICMLCCIPFVLIQMDKKGSGVLSQNVMRDSCVHLYYDDEGWLFFKCTLVHKSAPEFNYSPCFELFCTRDLCDLRPGGAAVDQHPSPNSEKHLGIMGQQPHCSFHLVNCMFWSHLFVVLLLFAWI